ncbi:MAG TPA: tyrosine-type recombinase/integrase [Gammaproteobacteria bacterium]|nr:tyrosine-type recombinase/integrase [Gammaproteobacteria bacterium]
MPLTDTRIRTAKPTEKPYKMADGGGLYIEIKPTGAKLWRLRYRIAGKENVFAIGDYRTIGLAEARTARDQAKKLIKEGVHPSHQRKLERIKQAHEHANSFAAVAKEWLARNTKHWTVRTAQLRKRSLEQDVLPYIGALPVRQVTPAHVLDMVQRIEKRAPTMAALMHQTIGAICRYAVATLRADADPTSPLRGYLKPRQTEHHKPLAAAEIPGFLSALEAYPGHYSTKVALRLMLLTLVRTTEALGAKWSEFDMEQGNWVIPPIRMKRREAHTVPLSTQAIDLLERLRTVTGNGAYLFPNRNNQHKPASKGVLWQAVASMGYTGRFSPHGIRATGATILNERGYRPDVIEYQLAHQERNKTRASYNRAEYLGERREMMQFWADYLDDLRTGANVIPLKSRQA